MMISGQFLLAKDRFIERVILILFPGLILTDHHCPGFLITDENPIRLRM